MKADLAQQITDKIREHRTSETRGLRRILAGHRFGRLFILSFSHRPPNGSPVWIAACACGQLSYPSTRNLLARNGSRSCGCEIAESIRKRSTTHGAARSRLYRIWSLMRARCSPTGKGTAWEYYGARGVRVCDEWTTFTPFQQWAHAHGYADHLTIERDDVNGNYESSNCRWITAKQQGYNKRNSRRLTWNGETKTTAEWARDLLIPATRIKGRLALGWSAEEALSLPPCPQGSKKRTPVHN
jgi:hypothetical protein